MTPSRPHRAAVPALAAATVVAGLAVVPFLGAPAQAAPASLTTTYSCSTSFGTESADVKLSADFPSSVASGSTVAARSVGFSVTVPPRFVGYMRQFGVESVSGRGSKAAYRVGSTKHALRKVKLPKTAVPASGAMVLKGKGVASAFTAPAPGTYAVRVPSSFAATMKATTSSGDSSTIDLDCTLASGAPSKIGTLTVR
ncbi:hypothetical protein GCM10022215_22780 [Nocardioides fonticola]|uniref:DUF6801 domain-containing protein n=1 Tax=Nocardioides fonticola TaxID=450363 RepID=A0ABP7XK40_9ACTN